MLLFHTLDVDASENVTAADDSHTNVSHGFAFSHLSLDSLILSNVIHILVLKI